MQTEIFSDHAFDSAMLGTSVFALALLKYTGTKWNLEPVCGPIRKLPGEPPQHERRKSDRRESCLEVGKE